MFTKYEKRFLRTGYFVTIREENKFLEFKSKNTQHCWMIFRRTYTDLDRPFDIYHKHKQSDPYYHKHYQTYTIGQAIKSIKSHDAYVMEQRRTNMSYKKNRTLTVHESSGYNYKPTPSILLKGEWLKELSFEPGVKINVECEGGKLVITRQDEIIC